jgi:serine/threonine protein kinase/tetratricopeptide (TPR) repeat protein
MNHGGNGRTDVWKPPQGGSESPGAGPDDPRVIAALEEYVSALQAGQAPDRDAFQARHPEIAAVLAECLDGLEWLRGATLGGRPAAAAAAAPAGAGVVPGTPLGDYRILREVGRGGMGVVYEAIQLSLGRRVALKVLPFASTLDGRQLQRFKNEAHAAASLHHTNIVPVHATGCERSVHYYAMQFIDGRTLAELIAELRQQASRDPTDPQRTGPYLPVPPGPEAPPGGLATPPPVSSLVLPAWIERPETSPGAAATPAVAALSTLPSPRNRVFYRLVARLGIQAAEALEHAHQLGVLHRDIKPGNLLIEHTAAPLGEQGEGEGLRLWVTDFGLAHCQSQAGLTLTGDLVGTLRYMSPEQALAKRIIVDHRTDIYSLGATLYELLTLQPAFGGCHPQELLRQIALEEPKPPRRLNRAVPAELEVIVGKAMAKDLAERYATAQELADDLERFLKDEPIRARRPALVQRARKWARRHRALVWSAALVSLLAALMAGINGMWLAQRRSETAGAVEAVLQEAKTLQAEEKWPEALAAARRAEALVQLGGGGDGLRHRVQQLLRDLEMVRRLEEARLQRAAGAKGGGFDWEASHAAYARAFRWYGLEVERLEPKEAAERIRSCPIRLQLAAALDDWAGGQRTLGLKGWRQLVAVSRAADPNPWRNRLRDALERKDPRALQEVAASVPDDHLPPATAVLLGRLSLGTGAAAQAVAVLQKVWQRHPGDFLLNEELGLCLHEVQPPRLQEALPYYLAAVALRPVSPGAHMNLGNALGDLGRLDGAIAEYREAIRINKDFAEAHNNLGAALYKKGRLDDAIAEYRESLRLNKGLSVAHKNLGAALYAKGELDGAIAEYREALRIKKGDPEAHTNLGNALKAKGRLRAALAEHLQAGGFKRKPNSPETFKASPRTIKGHPGTMPKTIKGHPHMKRPGGPRHPPRHPPRPNKTSRRPATPSG